MFKIVYLDQQSGIRTIIKGLDSTILLFKSEIKAYSYLKSIITHKAILQGFYSVLKVADER